MCGIAGAYSPLDKPVTAADVLENMRDQMVHRGPDGGGLWSDPTDDRCALAHRRLSIIDLSEAANQPMANDDETVVLVFNGEIYNHAELRKELEATGKYRWRTDHSDTEMLLHAYEEWGLDCVDRLQGMFAFAVYDRRNRDRPQLHLVRDRIGIKPLYFTRTGHNEWLFASEIRALLVHPDVPREMDRTAFWHYLTFIVTPAPMTLFRGVFKIPAGHIVSIDANGNATARQYWDPVPSKSDMIAEDEMSPDDAAAELKRLLRQSIARRMVSDVPFGVLLSGGVDSSLNVALMSELMDRPVTSFTIGYEGKEDYNEFQFARRISEQYQTDHHETLINRNEMQEFLPLMVRLQDEPIADNVCIPLYFLAKLVKDSGTTVVQVGEGADENFLGYWWCDHYRDKYQTVYDPIRKTKKRSLWRKAIEALLPASRMTISQEDRDFAARAERGQHLFWGGAVCWHGDLRSKLTPSDAPFRQPVECPVPGLMPDSHTTLDSHEVVRNYLDKLNGDLLEPEVLQQIPYMEMKLRLPEHLLMRVDKLTMAHSIEARVPFLDHDVVDFARRLPPAYKLVDGVGKHVLKRVAEDYLPDDLVYRRKQGFGAPMEEWFQEGDFGKRCEAAFQRSRIVSEGFLDKDYFLGMLRNQMNGQGGYSFHLWTVMNAVMWHESWIEGREDCL